MGTDKVDAVDVETQVDKLWEQRRMDKESAKVDAEKRHVEVMRAIGGLQAELKRLNGTVAGNDRRLIALETLENERNRAGRSPAIAAAGGSLGGAGLTLVLVGKLMGWW